MISLDEQMIPYPGMRSTKQTMIRFCFKDFWLTTHDGYLCGKREEGTPGKGCPTANIWEQLER